METSNQPCRSCCSSPWWVVAVVLLLLIAVWRAFNAGQPPEGYAEDKRGAERLKIRETALAADAEKLSSYAAIDAAKGVYRIPVADAKKLVAGELAQKKATPSKTKVDPWLPMPPPPDPNAVEPPPSALTSAPQGADTIRFDVPAPAAPAK